MNVGIVGVGFVGNAVLQTSRRFFNTLTFDTDPEKSDCATLHELVERTDLIFVCVPTPMRANGTCNTNIVRDVVTDIEDAARTLGVQKSVVIKSTVPIGTTDNIARDLKLIRLSFNPEFLTERNAVDDFAYQPYVVIGNPSLLVMDFYSEILQKTDNPAYIFRTTAVAAEAIKYAANTFLAMKVTFSNELKDYLDAMNVDHAAVVSILKHDRRLGSTHWDVPGPDGMRGFGGTCFPKDVNALLTEMDRVNVDKTLLEAMWKKNLLLRPERDWEQLKGRAVS